MLSDAKTNGTGDWVRQLQTNDVEECRKLIIRFRDSVGDATKRGRPSKEQLRFDWATMQQPGPSFSMFALALTVHGGAAMWPGAVMCHVPDSLAIWSRCTALCRATVSRVPRPGNCNRWGAGPCQLPNRGSSQRGGGGQCRQRSAG